MRRRALTLRRAEAVTGRSGVLWERGRWSGAASISFSIRLRSRSGWEEREEEEEGEAVAVAEAEERRWMGRPLGSLAVLGSLRQGQGRGSSSDEAFLEEAFDARVWLGVGPAQTLAIPTRQ